MSDFVICTHFVCPFCVQCTFATKINGRVPWRSLSLSLIECAYFQNENRFEATAEVWPRSKSATEAAIIDRKEITLKHSQFIRLYFSTATISSCDFCSRLFEILLQKQNKNRSRRLRNRFAQIFFLTRETQRKFLFDNKRFIFSDTLSITIKIQLDFSMFTAIFTLSFNVRFAINQIAFHSLQIDVISYTKFILCYTISLRLR